MMTLLKIWTTLNYKIMKFKHTSVLLHETIDNLKPKNGGLYVDATFGGGGHAKYLLSKIETTVFWI